MTNTIALMLILNDYIYKSISVFNNIKDSIQILQYEASAIEYAKCVLINKQELEDFYINGYDVSVDRDGNDYYLSSYMGTLRLITNDGLILDYNNE